MADARGRVVRITIEPPDPRFGSTFVVKHRDLGDEWSRTSFATERAALDVLSHRGLDVAPRILAVDEDANVLALSDVGGTTVEDALFGDDPDRALRALLVLARATALVHRCPVGSRRLTDRDTWTIGAHAIHVGRLTTMVDDLGFPSAASAVADAREVVDRLGAPGAAAALVHGDVTPSNAVLGGDGQCRLVDFEGAAIQHFGVDACMLRFPFAWYARWALVPADVQAMMERAYRSELHRPDRDVDDAIALGCAAMTLVRLDRLRLIDDPTESPEKSRRRRVQIVATLDVAADAMEHSGSFARLETWFRTLAAAMRARWDDAAHPAPGFPAFGSG